MPIWSDKRCSCLALQMIPGLGNIACKNLLARFGDPEGIFQAPISELTEVGGIRRDVALKIAGKKYAGDPEAELEKAENLGVKIINYPDPAYPKALKEIYDSPMILYLKGRDIPGNTTFVAVVGSRKATHYGLRVAEKIGQGLARCGLGVV